MSARPDRRPVKLRVYAVPRGRIFDMTFYLRVDVCVRAKLYGPHATRGNAPTQYCPRKQSLHCFGRNDNYYWIPGGRRRSVQSYGASACSIFLTAFCASHYARTRRHRRVVILRIMFTCRNALKNLFGPKNVI